MFYHLIKLLFLPFFIIGLIWLLLPGLFAMLTVVFIVIYELLDSVGIWLPGIGIAVVIGVIIGTLAGIDERRRGKSSSVPTSTTNDMDQSVSTGTASDTRAAPVGDVEPFLQLGIAALKEGNKSHALALLKHAVQVDASNQLAWLWLSGCVESIDERRECLRRVLIIGDGTEAAQRARKGLEQLAKLESE